MNYLVTGAAGFIGSSLGNYLVCRGHEVIGLDNFSHPSKNHPVFPIQYADVRYSEDLEDFIKNADRVYHLAAQINVDKSIAHPQETADINFHGTENVLNLCRRYHKPLVFASSSEVYGGQAEILTESSPTYAQSPYAVSKLAADKLCGNYHQLYGLEVYRMRCFNTYGPFQSEDQYGAVIPLFVKAALQGKPLQIFGDGEQERDFIHVSDVVRAYELLPTLKDLVGEPVNVGSGSCVTVNRLADLINRFTGNSQPCVHLPARPGEVRRLRADTTLISRYGFTPTMSFTDGLAQYVGWYKQQ